MGEGEPLARGRGGLVPPDHPGVAPPDPSRGGGVVVLGVGEVIVSSAAILYNKPHI